MWNYINNVIPAWHGLRTSLTWTVNKQGGIQRKTPVANIKSLKVPQKHYKNSHLNTKNETFKLAWESPNQNTRVLYFSLADFT